MGPAVRFSVCYAFCPIGRTGRNICAHKNNIHQKGSSPSACFVQDRLPSMQAYRHCRCCMCCTHISESASAVLHTLSNTQTTTTALANILVDPMLLMAGPELLIYGAGSLFL